MTEIVSDGLVVCNSCLDGNHDGHQSDLAGICIGCMCEWRPRRLQLVEDEGSGCGGGEESRPLTTQPLEEAPVTPELGSRVAAEGEAIDDLEVDCA